VFFVSSHRRNRYNSPVRVSFSVCCRTTLRKLEVQICGNIQKINLKIVSLFTKTETSFCHMAERCHNSCSKCPSLFARTHARRRPRHSSTVLLMVWSVPWQTCRNAASVHNTCLDKIVCYLRRIFNRNRKLKQQVSK